MPNIDIIRVDNVDYNVVGSAESLPVGSEIDYDGSTVPDGWQEVDDIIPVIITRNTSNISTSELKMEVNVIGRVCYYNIMFKPITALSAGGTQILFSNMPIPLTEQGVVGSNGQNGIRMKINSSGDLQLWYSDIQIPTNVTVYTSGSYIIKEE